MNMDALQKACRHQGITEEGIPSVYSCLVSCLLPALAGAGTASLSAAFVGITGRDRLLAPQATIGRAVPLLSEKPISDRSQNRTWLLYTVREVVRNAVYYRRGS